VIQTVRKAIGFLDAKQRRAWLRLIPISVTIAAMEAIGAATVLVLIRLIDEPTGSDTSPLAITLRDAALRWELSPIISLSAFIGVFYIAKNALRFMEVQARQRCAGETEASIATQLLSRYLRAPYAFHLQRNSAELIRNATNSASTVSRVVLLSATEAIAEILVVLGILAVVIYSAPMVALIAGGTVTIAMMGMLRLTQNAHSRWGKQNHALRASIMQSLQQSLGGVKEVKILGRENFFTSIFARNWRELMGVQVRRGSLEVAPRLVVETLFVCGVMGVIIGLYAGGVGGVIPLLGLFAYAGLRILPSLHWIVYYQNNLRFGAAALDEIERDWRELDDAETSARSDDPLPLHDEIALQAASYRYEGTDLDALTCVDLAIKRGESVGIVGATGAGKSTLVDLILGLLDPTAGSVRVDGIDIRERLSSWQRQIGYVPQSIYLMDDSIRRNIAFGVDDEAIDDERVATALRMAQIEEFIQGLPLGLDTVVGERGVRLSGGQRQRLAVARALYHDPEVLVFDEATAALDSQTESELAREIQSLQRKKTLIIIAHRLDTVRHCDRLIFLIDGRVVDAAPFDELELRNPAFRNLVTPPS
jgi:ATP-binding cassette subfamily C protein